MNRSNSPWFLVLIALGSGVLAALLTAVLMPAPDVPKSSARANLAVASEVAELRDRVALLEKTVEALQEEEDRSGRGPSRAQASNVQGGGRSAQERAPRERKEGRISGESLAEILKSDNPEVREQLSNAVRDEIAIEREERHLRRMERHKERSRERATEFAERIGLSPGDSDDFVKLVVDERSTVMETFRAARDGTREMTREEAMNEVRALREKTDMNVAKILNKEQYEEYVADRKAEEERFQRRWGRGDRDRGGRDRGKEAPAKKP